jgi:hypothetical protein
MLRGESYHLFSGLQVQPAPANPQPANGAARVRPCVFMKRAPETAARDMFSPAASGGPAVRIFSLTGWGFGRMMRPES